MTETRKVLSNKMAKLPWVNGRGLDTKKSLQLQYIGLVRDVEWSTLGPRKLLNMCRSQRIAQLAL